MKKLLMLLLLIAGAPYAQNTTTVTGTVKDLAQVTVTSGKVVFSLRPNIAVTISVLQLVAAVDVEISRAC